jgi:hypothetical protein
MLFSISLYFFPAFCDFLALFFSLGLYQCDS